MYHPHRNTSHTTNKQTKTSFNVCQIIVPKAWKLQCAQTFCAEMQQNTHNTLQACAHTSMCVEKQVHMQTCVHLSAQTFKHTSMQAYKHARIQNTSMNTCTHANMHAGTYTWGTPSQRGRGCEALSSRWQIWYMSIKSSTNQVSWKSSRITLDHLGSFLVIPNDS